MGDIGESLDSERVRSLFDSMRAIVGAATEDGGDVVFVWVIDVSVHGSNSRDTSRGKPVDAAGVVVRNRVGTAWRCENVVVVKDHPQQGVTRIICHNGRSHNAGVKLAS
jgi:hypothetical protein